MNDDARRKEFGFSTQVPEASTVGEQSTSRLDWFGLDAFEDAELGVSEQIEGLRSDGTAGNDRRRNLPLPLCTPHLIPRVESIVSLTRAHAGAVLFLIESDNRADYGIVIHLDVLPLQVGRGTVGHPTDGGISRRHCVISTDDAGLVIEDLNSQNGTFVNGERIGRAALHYNDVVTIGSARLVCAKLSSIGT